MAMRPTGDDRPRQFSLLQAFGVMTAFAVAYGLWHTNSFEFVIASAVALGGSSIILLGSKRERFALLLRSIVCVSIGLTAAAWYAAKWDDDEKLIQISIATTAAVGCWAIISFATWILALRTKQGAPQNK